MYIYMVYHIACWTKITIEATMFFMGKLPVIARHLPRFGAFGADDLELQVPGTGATSLFLALNIFKHNYEL